MATNQQSPLEQVLAAAAPALAYQPDEYEQAEAKYYAEQEEKMRGLGKGSLSPTSTRRTYPTVTYY